MDETQTVTQNSNDPESTYLSFANPNYCFEDQVNFNLKEATTNNGHLTLDKLSLNSDDIHQADHQDYPNSDYSSAEATPSSPDRSFILRKLNSSGDDDDEDDDDTDVDDDDDSSVVEDDDDEMQHNLLSSKEDVREEAVYVGGRGGEGSKKGRGILGYLAMLEAQAREREADVSHPGSPDEEVEDTLDSPTTNVEVDKAPVVSKDKGLLKDKFEETDINSPDSNDSGIQSDARSDDGVSHVHGPVTAEPYAVVDKKADHSPYTPDTPDSVYEEGEVDAERRNVKNADALPPGWQKHEDEDGPYYWHIKSGTIQRDPPPPAPPDGPTVCTAPVRSISLNSDTSSQTASSVPSTPTSVTSNTERHLQEFEGHALQYAAKSLQSLVSQPERRLVDPEGDVRGEGAIRFAVRSLGWVRIAEEDLTPERSSKAVNKCIVDLSLGRNDINDAVGRWGDGKDLYMDIDSSSLRLLDPSDGTLLNSQPIHSIRVWGVGRDNGRDFAYVARDRMTRMHMCHVFQCDTPARQIANTLRDICKRIMQERGLQPAHPTTQRRPTDLPNLEKLGQPPGSTPPSSLFNNSSFPTPMEEPRKVLRCHYLGSHEVIRPTGVDVLNEAIDWMYYHMPPEKWTFVNVAVAPSTITITEHGNPDNILEECRVRFMSFMGISVSSVKLCAFIMHTAQNKFLAHVFHCEPSAGPLCKTIEAACKLRYQKCLDAHPQTTKPTHNGKSVSAMLKAGVKASMQGVQTIFGLIKNKAAAPSSSNS